jgi:hypothetical protein
MSTFGLPMNPALRAIPVPASVGKKVSKTRVEQNGGQLRMNVIGMVCPHTGQFFAHV